MARHADKSNGILKRHANAFINAGIIIIALALALALTPFIRNHVWNVAGDSMMNTYYNGDIVFGAPYREGDKIPDVNRVIIFKDTDGWTTNRNDYLIKRVIAHPGDVIRIDDKGEMKINGKTVHDVNGNYDKTCQKAPVTIKVPAHKLFVRGDNAQVSDDSRYQACLGNKSLVDLNDIKMVVHDGFHVSLHKLSFANIA